MRLLCRRRLLPGPRPRLPRSLPLCLPHKRTHRTNGLLRQRRRICANL